MNADKFKKLMIDLRNLQISGDAWLDKVPNEINSAFFDNPYVAAQDAAKDVFLNALFENALLEEVYWFLYEWSPEKDVSYRTLTYADGTTCVINDVNDFTEHLIKDELLF